MYQLFIFIFLNLSSYLQTNQRTQPADPGQGQDDDGTRGTDEYKQDIDQWPATLRQHTDVLYVCEQQIAQQTTNHINAQRMDTVELQQPALLVQVIPEQGETDIAACHCKRDEIEESRKERQEGGNRAATEEKAPYRKDQCHCSQQGLACQHLLRKGKVLAKMIARHIVYHIVVDETETGNVNVRRELEYAQKEDDCH